MNFLSQYGLFLLKTATLVAACLLLAAGLLSLRRKPHSALTITPINEEINAQRNRLIKAISGKKAPKTTKSKDKKPSLFVLDFVGDLKASQVESLREEISAVLSVATPNDEVLLRLESPGGSVNGYGLAAAQLQRLRDHSIPLTVCIDKVAASGGYLMACVANQIIAAPFAIVGSIGVVAQMPNVHRWLKKHNVDVELLTAGEYKRTLTVFGENTDKGRKKFQQDLEQIHDNFRDYVLSHRQQVELQQVATGEHWLAKDALKLHLVDRLETSDDVLRQKLKTAQGFQLSSPEKLNLISKIMKPMAQWVHPWA